jgi:SAM-dependent methyltransferase
VRPSRLAAIAALLGFPAAAPERCRVLELGAGDGALLIPLALERPESEFLGMDLSGKAIERGRARIRELGLTNITLQQADIASFSPSQPFDYILAHGVYSWVPAPVQVALLALCRRALAPQGLAYLSYATYPGCHQREMVRNLMLFHTARLAGAPGAEIVKEGLGFARFIAQNQTSGEAYGRAIEQELKRMESHDAGYAFHDDFSEHNSPVYFGEMVENAREHGLEFLAEALFLNFDDGRLSPEVSAMVEQLSGGDRVMREQYLDFLRGRAFRQSLFCHAGQVPTGAWQLEHLFQLSAASALQPKSPEEQGVDQPFVRAALSTLAERWPVAMPVRELFERATALAGAATPQARAEEQQLLLRTLLRGAAARVVELEVAPPAVAAAVSERPRASALARLEARAGLLVTDLWHKRLKLEDEASAFLLGLLDGTRTHAQLADAMERFFAEQAAAPLPRAEVERQLELVLTGMQRRALLLD